MSQTYTEEQPSRREANDGIANTMPSATDPQDNLQGGPISLVMDYDNSDWVSDFGDDWCGTPSTEDQVYSTSPASHHSTTPLSNDPYYNALRLLTAEEELENAREREIEQATVIRTHVKHNFDLIVKLNKEETLSQSLGRKLSDLFVVVTQNQQYELDKVQRRLLDLQADAENGCFGQTWRDLQQRLHNLNSKLDTYIGTSTPKAIFARTHTDELTLFLGGLLEKLPKIRKELERLSQYIEEEKIIDAENKPQGDEPVRGQATKENTSQENIDNADLSITFSATNILDRYYEFSRLHREMMERRRAKLQELLNKTSTELSRLQADLAYEEGRTSNMRIRMEFWGDGLGESRVECPFPVLENLEMKELALYRGSKELQDIIGIIQGLPSRFRIIDIRGPEEYKTSIDLESVYTQAKEPSEGSSHTVVEGQQEDATYVAELEAKVKEMQANEKAWAAHFESLHRRENDAKVAMQKQIKFLELRNEEVQQVVTAVTGKLFQRRDRLWDLSTTARQLGEELISTLEKLGVSCDKRQVLENEW